MKPENAALVVKQKDIFSFEFVRLTDFPYLIATYR